jgi:TolB-like protein/Tfp pilus assembly protein PilF
MPHSNNLCYEFGSFRFNVGQRVLTQAEVVISLGEKATEVLLFLLRNAGQLVGKEELMRGVWPDSFVEEANLTQNIFTLRRALGDDRASARYIETLPRRGYRFVAPVKKVEIESPRSETGAQARDSERRSGPSPILAVLPFVNTTGDEGLEYLADGISDSIINNLSQISKLRVMSRSAVFRYKGSEYEFNHIAAELKVDAMLVGKIVSCPSGLAISAELVEAGNGWLLWGQSFDCELKDIFEVQDEIARQISTALRLKLTGEEEKRITTRYTENSGAYQAYIEGRFHWSRYTRNEIEKAIGNFRKAIELDPNYALAYAAIVDCYLRLATNYLPSESISQSDDKKKAKNGTHFVEAKTSGTLIVATSDPKVKLRHEWDWKGAEREIRRANALKADYPAAHQWHAAYWFLRQLYETSTLEIAATTETHSDGSPDLPVRIPFGQLPSNEEVQVFCAIAREQIDVGNYEAACLVLKRWWTLGSWPRLSGLDSKSCADLLFTTGEVAGFVASAQQIPDGQKNAELLLSGSIALFEQLGSLVRASEARIELALSYYRQGNFDLARSTFTTVLGALRVEDSELHCLALIRLASLERHAGRPNDALNRLREAKTILEALGPWVTGRHHLELASTYQEIAISEGDETLFDSVLDHFRASLYEFEAIGNLRLMGIAQNNLGFLLLTVGDYQQAYSHLVNARRMFEGLGDKVRCAQVDDTLARLHLAEHKFELAEQAANRAIDTLQFGDEDVLLAEVLTTKGVVSSRLHRYREATRILESAHAVAARCGDRQGAGRALLVLLEEMGDQLSSEDRLDIGSRLRQLSVDIQLVSLRKRVDKALEVIKEHPPD